MSSAGPSDVTSGVGHHMSSEAVVDIYLNYPHKLSAQGYTIVACILTAVWVFGTILNVTCLVVFTKTKRLRSPTNAFVMALNACDLGMSCCGTFMAMTSSWNGQWLYGRQGCIFEGFMVYFLGLTSMHLLCAIAVDRYIVIAQPLLGAKITLQMAYYSIGVCWFFGFLWAGLPLIGWNQYVLEGGGVSCSVVWEAVSVNYSSYIFTIFVFCFLLPLAAMFFSYYGIFLTIRKLSRSHKFDKTSRIAKKNLRVEKKMAKTIAVVVAGFWFCWMPYTVVSFLVTFHGPGVISPEMATYPAVLAKSQGVVNPLLYVVSNKQFRQALYALLPCGWLREVLVRQEEAKEDTEESDDETKTTGKSRDGKSEAQTRGGGQGRGNKVTPAAASRRDREVTEEGVTVMEDLGPDLPSTSEVVQLQQGEAGPAQD